MRIVLALLALPLVEILLFIQIGGLIGVWWVLALVLLSAVVGVLLIRSLGAHVTARLRQSIAETSDLSEPVAHAALLFLAGSLLILPGFMSDAIALLLLMPPVRNALYRSLRSRVRAQAHAMRSGGRADMHGDVIDGTFHDVGPDDAPEHGSASSPVGQIQRHPSGWTRHE